MSPDTYTPFDIDPDTVPEEVWDDLELPATDDYCEECGEYYLDCWCEGVDDDGDFAHLTRPRRCRICGELYCEGECYDI